MEFKQWFEEELRQMLEKTIKETKIEILDVAIKSLSESITRIENLERNNEYLKGLSLSLDILNNLKTKIK